ncbi:hypothetical protein [Dysgonomonas sp. 25]|uniref:hypothetical protein n=1 Tax=Dysgonomonas sp. 25 TaxID=2302933 RepID=UPI0013D70FBF|nr:hypothetical protein [Dysgonomonas sp. 25]NDV69251.1 hypothetical protein [Dysgonomonas sp. 25]
MAKLSFKAELENSSNNKIFVSLELYEFIEDGMNIIYCPALDLSSYGRNEDEAKKGFQETFEIYINYCMSKKTLVKDLQRHGWNVKSAKQKKMKAPSTKDLLNSNDTLQDIIYNKDYVKMSEKVAFPALA